MLAMQEKYFTPEQVAEALLVSSDTILRLIRNKKIQATQIGGQWRIGESALQNYIDERSNIKSKPKPETK